MVASSKETQIRNAVARLVLQQVDRKRAAVSRGGPRRKLSTAYVLDRIFVVARTGAFRRNLEVQNGLPKTIFHHFNIWSKQRVFDEVFHS